MQNSRIFLNSRATSCSVVENQNETKGYRSDTFRDARAARCNRPVQLQRSFEPSALIIVTIQKTGCLAVFSAKNLTFRLGLV